MSGSTLGFHLNSGSFHRQVCLKHSQQGAEEKKLREILRCRECSSNVSASGELASCLAPLERPWPACPAAVVFCNDRNSILNCFTRFTADLNDLEEQRLRGETDLKSKKTWKDLVPRWLTFARGVVDSEASFRLPT